MKLSIATILVGSAAATSIRATSKAGSKLLSNARRLNGDGDMTWVANYSLKFEKCATTTDYYGGQFDGNNNNNNYQQQQQQQWQGGMYERKVVHFKLCPTDTCGSGCSGGADYVVDMDEFVGSYLEYKMELQEQECETAKENSGCENYDDEEVRRILLCLYNDSLLDIKMFTNYNSSLLTSLPHDRAACTHTLPRWTFPNVSSKTERIMETVNKRKNSIFNKPQSVAVLTLMRRLLNTMPTRMDRATTSTTTRTSRMLSSSLAPPVPQMARASTLLSSWMKLALIPHPMVYMRSSTTARSFHIPVQALLNTIVSHA